MVSTIFSDAANTKHFNVDFVFDSGDRVTIPAEHVITFENKFERDNPVVEAYMMFKDIADSSKDINWRKVKIAVYILDGMEQLYFRDFIVVNTEEPQNNTKEKFISLKMQDEVSYTLGNLFITKSFTGKSRCACLKEIIETYNLPNGTTLDKILSEYNLSYIFEEDEETSDFVISKGESVLSQFQKEFKRIGYSMFSNRKGLNVKKQASLLPDALVQSYEYIVNEFKQQVKQQCYPNKVHEFKNQPLNKEDVNATPNAKSNYFDASTKKMVQVKNTDANLQSTNINSDTENVKDTVGSKAVFSTKKSDSGFVASMTDSFMKKAQTTIFVRGYFDRDINKVITLSLPGSRASQESSIEGDTQNTGKYLITKVIDKFLTGKLIQKINLARSDQN